MPYPQSDHNRMLRRTHPMSDTEVLNSLQYVNPLRTLVPADITQTEELTPTSVGQGTSNNMKSAQGAEAVRTLEYTRSRIFERLCNRQGALVAAEVWIGQVVGAGTSVMSWHRNKEKCPKNRRRSRSCRGIGRAITDGLGEAWCGPEAGEHSEACCACQGEIDKQ